MSINGKGGGGLRKIIKSGAGVSGDGAWVLQRLLAGADTCG